MDFQHDDHLGEFVAKLTERIEQSRLSEFRRVRVQIQRHLRAKRGSVAQPLAPHQAAQSDFRVQFCRHLEHLIGRLQPDEATSSQNFVSNVFAPFSRTMGW